MKVLLVWLLFLMPQATEPYKHRLELEPMLQDAEALRMLTVLYQPPAHHGFQLFFVRGDGSLIVQGYPQRPIATTDIPTCRNKVSQDKVKELVSLLVNRHFWDLPEKRFLFLGGMPRAGELELHQLSIDNGAAKASRIFGVGTFADKKETIPDDFAAIEEQLIQLRDFTLSNKPCHFAPANKF